MDLRDGLEAALQKYSVKGDPCISRRDEVAQSNLRSPSSESISIDQTGQIAPPGKHARVTATLWEDEGCMWFQVEAKGVCVARRDDNHMINGTKLLNVAGVSRSRCSRLLKSEPQRSVVKIGPMHLQGIWITFDRALYLANAEKVTEELYPLFVHNVGAMLYHPANQGRPSVGTADQRQLNANTKDVVSYDEPRSPALSHQDVVIRNGTLTSDAGTAGSDIERPSLDRAYTFPTPPTSASSRVANMAASHVARSSRIMPSDAQHFSTPSTSEDAREHPQIFFTPSQKTYKTALTSDSADLVHVLYYSPKFFAYPNGQDLATYMAASSSRQYRKKDMGPPRESPDAGGSIGLQSKIPEIKDEREEENNDEFVSSVDHEIDAFLPLVDLSETSITQSEASDETNPESPREDAKVTIAFAKHQLIASLMQDVYAMFNTQWHGGPKKHARSQSTNEAEQPYQSQAANKLSADKGKKRARDRDTTPPDDNRRKRRTAKSKSSDPTSTDRKLLLACPFHKNNPFVYRTNHASGRDFRACAGPGFSTISRLK